MRDIFDIGRENVWEMKNVYLVSASVLVPI